LRAALDTGIFENLRNLSFGAAAGLVAAAGGLEKLQSGLDSYYENFFSDEEKRLQTIKQINAATVGSGLDAATATRDSFRALVDNAMRDTSEAGLKTTAALLGVASALAHITPAAVDASIAMQAAANAAFETTKTATDAALAAVQRAIDAEKTRIGVIRTAAQESVTSIKGVFELLKAQVAQLYGTVGSTNTMQTAQGNAFITQALATAKATGYLPDQQQLADAIAAARGGLDPQEFATQFEADKAALVMAGKLSQLKDLAEPQLTLAEQALQVAQDQLTALDAQMVLAQQQVDALNGINTSVMSVTAAIAALASAMAVQTAAKAATTATTTATTTTPTVDTSFGGDKLMQSVKAQSDLMAGASSYFFVPGINDLAAKLQGSQMMADILGGTAESQLLRSTGKTSAEWSAIEDAAKLGIVPAFAVGTNYVPRDMIAQIHEGEAIVPRAYNPAAGGGGNNDRMERLIEGLTAEVQRLQAIVAAGNDNTRQFADQFDNVTEGGNAIRQVAV